MARGKASAIELGAEERRDLERLVRGRLTAQALAQRARIVLAAAEGDTNVRIAERLGVFKSTVGRWRERFALHRLDGLYDEPRPGAPRKIGDEEIAETIRLTLETLPQGAIAFNLRGNLLSTRAGPIGVAAGVEHRRDTVDFNSDPVSAVNGWRSANSQPYEGKVTVREGYAEALVPLAVDRPFAKKLEVDLVGRVAHYSTSGSATTWKAGVDWALNDQVRLRGSYSRDFRAPSINELFAGATTRGGTTVVDRTTNISTVTSTQSGGNPDLQPEVGHALTLGVVLEPEFFPRLRLSVDIFDIKLDGAISIVPVQDIIDRCFAGNQVFCDGITRDATGKITLVKTVSFNADKLKTNGVDFEVAYSLPMDDILPTRGGTLSVRSLTTYVEHLSTITNGVPSDLAGQLTGAGVPHWRSATTLQYETGSVSVRLLAEYIGKGTYSNSFGPLDINDNRFPARVYLHTTLQYEVNENIEVFSKIRNLLNTDPMILPETTLIRASPASTSLAYDQIGREYTVGVRYRW